MDWLAHLEGDLERAIDEAGCALSLAKEDADPIAHTGLLSVYSYSLIMTCRYQESLKHIEALMGIAESFGVEFPVHFAQLFRARALVGMRRFAPADRALSTLERQTKDTPGGYFRVNAAVARAGLYVSVGDMARALDVLSPGPVEHSDKAARAEFLALQALLHAATGDLERALALSEEANLTSRGLEARVLSLLAKVIVALGGGDTTKADSHLQEIVDSRVGDPVVIAVRALPALGEFIAGKIEWRSWLQRLLTASSDSTLANRLGLQVPRAAKRAVALTPRESEVHDLIAQGLTNEEIANVLFISLSTTKVHAKHIYEKLGVRSRLEAARALRDDV